MVNAIKVLINIWIKCLPGTWPWESWVEGCEALPKSIILIVNIIIPSWIKRGLSWKLVQKVKK